MDPETQRLFTVALIGLLLLFPVFNQVARTAVEALTDADHEAQFDDFFKSWDQIPDDRKLEYWDGRNPPPDAWEGGEPPDDFTSRGGSNGNGSGNEEEEEEGEEEEEEEEQRIEYETDELWRFPPAGESGSFRDDRDELPVEDYHWVNITWRYQGFNGNAEFELSAGGEEEWTMNIGSSGIPAVFADDNGSRELEDIGTAPMEIRYLYDPISPPNDFLVVITGTYPVLRGG